ncbi:hypothetical protein BGC30_05510 [Novacetimonas hansenii]|nr:hypothetical protein BGC30_05510 [Novacetimonas hansenii]
MQNTARFDDGARMMARAGDLGHRPHAWRVFHDVGQTSICCSHRAVMRGDGMELWGGHPHNIMTAGRTGPS